MAVFILILTLIPNLLFGIFVFKNNPKSATNIIYGILSLLISIWLVILQISLGQLTPADYLLCVRSSIFIATPMSLCFFLLAHTLPQNSLQIRGKKLMFIFLSTIIVMLITISPYAFTGAEAIKDGIELKAGPGMAPFGILTTFYSVGAVYLLFKKSRKAVGMEKGQFRFVNLGILMMLGLIIITIFIPVVIFKNTSFVSLAPIYTALFLGMTAYAIIKHKFLDIRLILVRAISFIFFILICAVIHITILFVLVGKIFSIKIDLLLSIISLVFSIVAALSFQPAYKFIRHSTSLFFYKDYFDKDKLLAQLTHIMATTIDLSKMTTRILDLLTKKMYLSKGAFFIMEKGKITDCFTLGYKETDLETKNISDFFTKTIKSKSYSFDDLPENKTKTLFREFDISIAIPIKEKGEIIAILILGPKLSGEVYNDRDTEFLNIFASEAGIAIQNAKSYEQIKKFNISLEKKVDERTAELQKSQKRELAKAQDIAHLKDEFVFIASHELRTPVTAIKGFLSMVTESPEKLPADVRENLSYMSAASDHLSQLINDLLEISRSDAGKMEVSAHSADIIPILQAIIMEITPQAIKDNIKIVFKDHPASLQAMVDDKKIKEVFMNLLSNAVKYNRKNGSIQVILTQEPKTITIEVKDTGYGISKDQQDKIFQKFFRATNERTGDVLGTGLGLFITRMLVEKMGGKISFTSVEGKGTTFKVNLLKTNNGSKTGHRK